MTHIASLSDPYSIAKWLSWHSYLSRRAKNDCPIVSIVTQVGLVKNFAF